MSPIMKIIEFRSSPPRVSLPVSLGRKEEERESSNILVVSLLTLLLAVYATSYHKVSAFTIDGQFLWEFGKKGNGEGELKSPCGLAIDESTGNLNVCDSNNGRLVVY